MADADILNGNWVK